VPEASSSEPVISADGRYIGFSSVASNRCPDGSEWS